MSSLVGTVRSGTVFTREDFYFTIIFVMENFKNDFTEGVDYAKDIAYSKNKGRGFVDFLLDLLNLYNSQDDFDKEITSERKEDLNTMLSEESRK